jgi:uncharacterized phiE125 gp8 family phage protein
MTMAIETLVEPTTEPVSVSEARTYLRIGTDGDDAVLENLLRAARETMENRTGQALVTRTVRQRFVGARTAGTVLPGRRPVQSILDARLLADDGTETDMPTGWVKLVDGRFWLARDVVGMRLDYVAGFGAASVVPQAHKIAILEMVGEALARRDGEARPARQDGPSLWDQAFSEVKL